MWIKICGITTVESALACVEAGADAIGFVFATGKRKISVEAAGRIITSLPTGLEKVGVFVDKPQEEVAEIEKSIGLDLLQFHGQESPYYCSLFPGKAIKSFRVSSARDFQSIEAYRGTIRACLLDSFRYGQAGGTGKTWNWELFSPAGTLGLSGIPYILAGGITAQNVSSALQNIKPYGVDTSSGVESGGQKDRTLIREFVRTVRRWENEKSA